MFKIASLIEATRATAGGGWVGDEFILCVCWAVTCSFYSSSVPVLFPSSYF